MIREPNSADDGANWPERFDSGFRLCPSKFNQALKEGHHARKPNSTRFGRGIDRGCSPGGRAGARSADDARSREGFTTLFNGKDFAGWHGLKTMDPRQFDALSADEKSKLLADGALDMKKHWSVKDGEIVNDGQGVYLTTDKDYGDVELFVDWKIGPQGDSGVYLRATPQIQIWDFTEPRYATRWEPTRALAACGTTARASW